MSEWPISRTKTVVGYVITVLVVSGLIAFRHWVSSIEPEAPNITRVDTAVLPIDDSDLDSMTMTTGPHGHPTAEDEEFERKFAEMYERASRPSFAATTTARDTTQPLRRAPIHVVHFDSPALPTPILDQRQRECIGYPLTAGFSRVRYNLLLQPNMYVVARKLWSDPTWLATFRVEGGTFPVNLWRARAGVPTFWKTVRVQAGPGLPTGNPQEVLSAEFFRGGDVLCVEATRSGGPLFVAYDQQTGLVVQPQLSVVENSSNDSTPMPGVWMVIGGEVQP